MKINSFKIFVLSLVFILLTSSSAYAGNLYKSLNRTGSGVEYSTCTYSDSQKAFSGKAKNIVTFKNSKQKVPKIKGPKPKEPKVKNPIETPPAVKGPDAKIHVTGVSLNKSSTTIAVGSWERLVAIVKPDNAAKKHVLWFSANPEVASVNPSGKVTGVGAGTTIIYAISLDSYKIACCSVTVTQGNYSTGITGIYLNKTNTTINVGVTETLTATVQPGNASNQAVTWFSGNPAIASVDQYGRVTGINSGTTQIYAATSGRGYVAYCLVTVVNGNVSVSSVSINLTTSSIILKPGLTHSLTAEVKPANAANKTVVWTSSNTSVAEIDQSGRVTAVAEGTTVIKVTTQDGSKTDQVRLRVISESNWEAVSLVRLNLLHTTLPVGEKDFLRYKIEPSDATNQEVTWTSSNPNVASVTGTGVVEAKLAGAAIITASSIEGDKRATCYVTVVPPVEKPSNGILFNKITSTLAVGMSDYPTVTLYPAGTTVSSLSWRTSNSSVATVSQTGRVTGKAPGDATITVRTRDNRTASYVIVVTQ